MKKTLTYLLSVCVSVAAHAQVDSVVVHELSIAQGDSLISNTDQNTADSISDLLDELRIPIVEADLYKTVKAVDSLAMSKAEMSRIPDSVFIQRLDKLDLESPFTLKYNNHVRGSLNAYLGKNARLTGRMLGMSEMYFPMFEEILDREGLPLELKYLAIVESALRPTARSRAGATGLWQFMYGTAKENGLEITSYIDERKAPRASTEAACKYLKKLYTMYDDWNLALAAYNSGPGNVNKAIRRAGGKKDYWAIWSHLPRETRGYIPAFIAVNYAMNYHSEHNVFPIEPKFRYAECDTVTVHDAMTFAQISKFTGTDIDHMRWLNPQYHRDFIPKRSSGMPLVLPISDIGDYIANADKIKEYEPPKVVPSPAAKTYASAKSTSSYYSIEGLVKESYTVRSGDVIGVIADRYGVGLSKLRYWNGISGSRIYPGQKLVVYRKPNHTVASQKDIVASNKSNIRTPLNPNARYHTIKPGDTLWDIAKLYDGVSVNQIKSWNSHLNFKLLKPGQKVRVSG